MAGLKSTNTTQYKAIKQSVSTTCIIQDIYTQYEHVQYMYMYIIQLATSVYINERLHMYSIHRLCTMYLDLALTLALWLMSSLTMSA